MGLGERQKRVPVACTIMFPSSARVGASAASDWTLWIYVVFATRLFLARHLAQRFLYTACTASQRLVCPASTFESRRLVDTASASNAWSVVHGACTAAWYP